MSSLRTLLSIALTLTTACGAAELGLEPDAGGDVADASGPVDTGFADATSADAEPIGADAAILEPDAGTAAPSYTRDVWPLFERRCQGCHFVTDNPPQIIGAAETWARLVDRPSPTVPSLDWVEPGDPDRSYLLRKVEGTHRAVGGRGNTMPPRVADPTTADERATLRAWITDGAPAD